MASSHSSTFCQFEYKKVGDAFVFIFQKAIRFPLSNTHTAMTASPLHKNLQRNEKNSSLEHTIERGIRHKKKDGASPFGEAPSWPYRHEIVIS
jgi:hypothetical protein